MICMPTREPRSTPSFRQHRRATASAPSTTASRTTLGNRGLLQVSRSLRIQRQLYPPIPIIIQNCYYRERPSGTATPNTGISVSWNGHRIAISARVQFTGPGATTAIANAMRADILRVWNAVFSDGYSSTCQVDMVMGDSDPTRATIVVGTGGSVDQSYTMGSTIHFMYSGSPSDLVWSPSHEFAHLLGLRDRRSTPWWDYFDTQPETSDPGYERNIMGALPGGDIARRNELVLESRNIRDWLGIYAMERVCRPIGGGGPPDVA